MKLNLSFSVFVNTTEYVDGDWHQNFLKLLQDLLGPIFLIQRLKTTDGAVSRLSCLIALAAQFCLMPKMNTRKLLRTAAECVNCCHEMVHFRKYIFSVI